MPTAGAILSDAPISGSGPPENAGSAHRGGTVDSAEGLLSLESYRCGDAVVVTVAGEIDMLTAAQMQEHLTAQLSACPEVVVVDLEGVGFLGSMGLTALALTQRAACEQGIDLRVVATSRATLRPLQVTGMAADLAIYPNRTEALAGCSGGGEELLPAPRSS